MSTRKRKPLTATPALIEQRRKAGRSRSARKLAALAENRIGPHQQPNIGEKELKQLARKRVTDFLLNEGLDVMIETFRSTGEERIKVMIYQLLGDKFGLESGMVIKLDEDAPLIRFEMVAFPKPEGL
jgi:aromatic ring-cleaving dioxygenase